MGTADGAKTEDFDPVAQIAVTRFRHTLLFPLALARGRAESGLDTPARDFVDRFTDALRRHDRETWVTIDPVMHCEPLAVMPPTHDVFAERYQETIFFHRFVQRFLYEDGRDDGDAEPARPLMIFRHRAITGVTVTVPSMDRFTGGEEIEADDAWRAAIAGGMPPVSDKGRRRWRETRLTVDTVNLHVFRAGIAVLAVTVSLPRDPSGAIPCVMERSTADPPERTVEPRRATVADLLDLTESVRRLYIPYWVKAAVGEPHRLALQVWADGVPSVVVWHAADAPDQRFEVPARDDVLTAFSAGFAHGVPPPLPWWAPLLPKSLVLRGTPRTPPETGLPEWRFVADERMATTTFLAVPNPARLSPGAWARLCFCDKAGDGFPYGDGFLKNFDALHAYDRFRTYGTRYVMCGYNFACVTNEGDFTDLVEMHMRRHYFQMVLIAQFQAAMLLAFSNWVSEAMEHYDVTADGNDEPARQRLRTDLHGIEREFQAFVHRYWFTGVSNQVQPSEIYAKLRDLLSLDKWFDEVLREIETSRGFLRDQEQERTARSAERLSLLAGLGLLVAVPAGLLGMNYSLGERTWLVGLLASEPVRRVFPKALSCVTSEKSDAVLSVSAQFGWTMLLVGLCAFVLWSFPHLPSNRSKRDRRAAGGEASIWLRRVAGWVAVVAAVLVAISLIAGPLCTVVPIPPR
ncbi:MAG: hypothetical protein R3D62_04130 [Xanthobacteraceae bacterium]